LREDVHRKESGAKSDRRALKKAINSLVRVMWLLVTKLDRMVAINMGPFQTLEAISKKGAQFKSLVRTMG